MTASRWARLLMLAALMMGVTLPAAAHESGALYLTLDVQGESIRGELDVGMGDARLLLALPPEPDAALAFRQIGERALALAQRVRAVLRLQGEGHACPLDARVMPQPPGEEAGLVRVAIAATCPLPIERLEVQGGLGGGGPDRAFVAVQAGQETHAAVLTRQQPNATFALRSTTAWGQLGPFFREGVQHVATGFDHLLFLTALLLPAALVRSERRWRPRESAREVIIEIAFVASAFTLAHSLTLCAAALQLVRPPPRLVESAIALTVLMAALNNLGPRLALRAPRLAFGLGLVHGFGFAAQLGILGLRPAARAVALLGFNLGVEAGQFAVVSAGLPLLLALRRNPRYQTFVLEIPSLCIAWVAGIWLFERVFGVTLLG